MKIITYCLLIMTFLISCEKESKNGSETKLPTDWTRFQFDQSNLGICDATPPRTQPTEVWKIDTGNGAILTSPLIYKGKVYFGTQSGEFYCLNISTGETIWVTQLTSGSLSSEIAIYNDILFVGDDDWVLHAISPATGETTWNVELNGDILACPIFYENNVIVTDEYGAMYSFDHATGQHNWGTNQCFGDGSPSIKGSEIYILSCEGGSPASGLENSFMVVDANTGDLKWKLDFDGNNFSSSPTVLDDIVVFGSSGHVYCVDLNSKSFKWDYETDYRLNFSNSANIFDNKVIIGCNTGASSAVDAHLLALDLTTGKFIWGSRYDERRFQIRTSSAIGSNNTIIGSVGHFGVIAYNLEDGEILWSHSLGGGGSGTSPVISGNYIIFCSNGGEVIALK